MTAPLRTAIGIAAFFSVGSIGHLSIGAVQQERAGATYALLIGATEYPSLPKQRWLEGPLNDVRLMVDVLQRPPFSVATANITTLTTVDLVDSRQRRRAVEQPTRANIRREFERLARTVGKNDQVVILMAGHGSQQPNQDDPTDEEPDGLDEIFLPSDIGKWNGAVGAVRNAIVDDDLRGWLTAIRQKGTFVWIIVDACQSGTITRGTNAERDRRVLPAVLGVPDAALRAASAQAASVPDSLIDVPSTAGDIAALYAADMRETTPEKQLPHPGDPWHGLFTYTIASILQQSRSSLTYRELAQRVIEHYRSEGRGAPNPMFEGGGVDREVLSARAPSSRPDLVLGNKLEGNRWQLRAGAVQGLTAGTVLEMFPPAGAVDGDRVVAYAQVVSVSAVTAVVEATAFASVPAAPERLMPASRGRIAAYSLGVDAMRVGVQVARRTARGAVEYDFAAEGRGPAHLERAIAAWSSVGSGLATRAQTEAEAEWVLRTVGGDVVFVPASGWNAPPGDSTSTGVPPAFSVARENDPQLVEILSSRLRRIVRVRNLLRLASASAAAATDLDFHVDLIRYDNNEAVAVPMDSGGRTLRAGDVVAFSIENRGRFPIDVTLLLVNDRYGIRPLYPPAESATAGRIGVNEKRQTTRFTVSASRVTLEQVVAVAVHASNPPMNFAALAQPSLEEAQRGVEDPRDRCDDVTTKRASNPLQELLDAATCGRVTTRSLTVSQVNDHAMRLIAWRAIPQ